MSRLLRGLSIALAIAISYEILSFLFKDNENIKVWIVPIICAIFVILSLIYYISKSKEPANKVLFPVFFAAIYLIFTRAFEKEIISKWLLALILFIISVEYIFWRLKYYKTDIDKN